MSRPSRLPPPTRDDIPFLDPDKAAEAYKRSSLFADDMNDAACDLIDRIGLPAFLATIATFGSPESWFESTDDFDLATWDIFDGFRMLP